MAKVAQLKLRAIQPRFEGSPVYEAAISGLVAVVLLIGVVWNMPDANITRKLKAMLSPVVGVAGLEQIWHMYAPEPIRRLETVEVHVTMADGSNRMWTNQKGELVIGAFSWYHWQKLKETAVREPEMRPGLAHWAVRQVTEPSEHPTRVRILLRTEALPPPDSDGPKTTAEETLYDEELAGPP